VAERIVQHVLQRALHIERRSHRARMNGLAALGQWKADLEKKAA